MKDWDLDGDIDWHDYYMASLNRFEKASVVISERIFTPASAILHTVWFILWFTLGLDINLLTMIVSLEAIYVSLFIGLSQNVAAKRDKVAQEHRDHLQENIEKSIEEILVDIHAKLDSR